MLSRRQFLKGGIAAGAYAAMSGSVLESILAAQSKKMNVLFIAVDDLRPQCGCYGVPFMKTPNIDALAVSGTQFNRAYCQQAVCSPSRTSLLTGRRPDTTRIYDLQTHFRLTIPDVVTLPEYFKKHGYHTQGLSKIFHGGLDDPQSWSVPHWQPHAAAYGTKEVMDAIQKEKRELHAKGEVTNDTVVQRDPKTGAALKLKRPTKKAMGPAWEAPDVPDNALADGMTADKAVEVLREVKDKPFFLAVGFLKPHLPFVAPKKYYDMYPLSQVKLADNPFRPKDAPEQAFAGWGELRQYKGIPKKGPVPDKEALELRRGYYAAASYTDAQIGKVVKELERLGLRDNTVIILWGDHGWQLGEHGEWCKHTNFEVATRSPMIISAPGQKTRGAKTEALAEFVDIYPTLCELCDLPIPDGLEGRSFAPLLDDPKREWKTAAFSQYPRGKVMGHSIRTDRYRYTEWAEAGKEPIARELYDHQTDPEENVNIAGMHETEAIVQELAQKLHAGWKAALPK